jgi:hypothetical protein
VAKHCYGDDLVGMFSFDCDRQALSIHARIGVATPDTGAPTWRSGHDRQRWAGRWMGMGMVWHGHADHLFAARVRAHG